MSAFVWFGHRIGVGGALVGVCCWFAAGCGDTEGTSAADAAAALDVSGEYGVTGFEAADTNAVAPSSLHIQAVSVDGGFDLAVTDNLGLSYPSSGGAPVVAEPTGSERGYAAGALVAEIPVSGSALSGSIRVMATAGIPLRIERVTNDSGQVTTRQGVHSISAGNARYELYGVFSPSGNTVRASAPARAGRIVW